jgi:hypothetical protein
MYRPAQPTQGASSVRLALFSQRNRDALNAMLKQDFQTKLGQPLSESQSDRLERALDHYVEQVYENQGEKPLSVLNREILRVTAQDFTSYIQRKEAVRQAPQAPVQTIANDKLFQDTSTRFDMLQQERQSVKALPPSMPDFRIPLDENGPPLADVFEQAKKQREQEALRQASMNTNKDAMDRIDPALQRRMLADDNFRLGQQGMNKATEFSLGERQLNMRTLDMPLVVPPDRRELMLPTNITIDPSGTPRELGQANSNPTITYPELASPQKVNLQQDVIIREERVVSYKEIENNLVLFSADRNWIKNSKETRYNFSVLFNPGPESLDYAPSNQRVMEKFRNITRIELVKTILPVEGLRTVIRKGLDDTVDSSYQQNVLSLPYVNVVIDELETNNYGTNNTLDRAFAVLQYDANWYSDPIVDTDSRGYTAFIPKFMKCQKVYEPTPLSTLQKLSIQLTQPNGQLLSTLPDVLDILMIYGAGVPMTMGSVYNVTEGGLPKYFFIFTSSYFSRFQFTVGDTIRVGNFTYANDVILRSSTTLNDFVTWINGEEGFTIVGIGHKDGSNVFVDGPNSVGYANCLIIDARYMDPTTGSTALKPFGDDINQDLYSTALNLASPRRVLNFSRQVQMVFRIITREFDPLGQIRPDNM